jgi:hypothetical protein
MNKMADEKKGIYEPLSGNVPTKVQTRAWEIRIDNPRDGDPTIHYRTEQMIIDDELNTVMLKDRRKTPDVQRRFSKIATQMITFKDPVTQQEITLSGYGVADAIAIFFEKFWEEDNG